MNTKELFSFSSKDAVALNDTLNQKIFDGIHMRSEVQRHLIMMADDFIEHLGIEDLTVTDVTISGSNCAYSYVDSSDIDLHIVVDLSKLNDDTIYRELFDAKRFLYNSDHNLKIRGIEVELYVQDANQPSISLGEYSVLHDKWIHFPKKRRANFDDIATQSKYNKILSIAEHAIKSQDAEKIDRLLATIRKYRQAGLDARGEFSTENLVFKRLRTNGVIKALRDTKDDLHSRELSLVETGANLQFFSEGIHRTELNKYFGNRADALGIESHMGAWRSAASAKVKPSRLDESAVNEIDPVLNRLKEVSYLGKIKIGDQVGILELEVSVPFKEIQVCSYPMRKITDIKLMPNGKINYVQFDDGNRYPTIPLATYVSKPLILSYYFTDVSSKDQAHTSLLLSLPDGWECDSVEPQSKPISESSGYIPSESEKHDPRWKTALTVDIKSDTMKNNAKKLGSKIARDGIPPTMRPDGKF